MGGDYFKREENLAPVIHHDGKVGQIDNGVAIDVGGGVGAAPVIHEDGKVLKVDLAVTVEICLGNVAAGGAGDDIGSDGERERRAGEGL